MAPSPYSRIATISPPWTVCPSFTRISLTGPARGASTGISIFMDSSTMTASPAPTRSPAFAVIWKTTPVMCALISSAIERSLFDHLRVHPPGDEVGVRDHPAEERDGRLHTFDHAPVQGPRHRRHPPRARLPGHDQLEQQRGVADRHRASRLDARLDPDPLAR